VPSISSGSSLAWLGASEHQNPATYHGCWHAITIEKTCTQHSDKIYQGLIFWLLLLLLLRFILTIFFLLGILQYTHCRMWTKHERHKQSFSWYITKQPCENKRGKVAYPLKASRFARCASSCKKEHQARSEQQLVHQTYGSISFITTTKGAQCGTVILPDKLANLGTRFNRTAERINQSCDLCFYPYLCCSQGEKLTNCTKGDKLKIQFHVARRRRRTQSHEVFILCIRTVIVFKMMGSRSYWQTLILVQEHYSRLGYTRDNTNLKTNRACWASENSDHQAHWDETLRVCKTH